MKIEKGLFPFKDALPYFLHRPIKAFEWRKLFEGDTKVRLYVVDMFYRTKFHPTDLYAMVDGERISFRAEVINELYGFPNEAELYIGCKLINHPTKGIVKEVLKTIV